MSRRSVYYGAVNSFKNNFSTLFDGLTEFTQSSAAFQLLEFQRNDPFSINLWVKWAGGLNGYIYYNGNRSRDEHYIQILSSGKVRFQFTNVDSGGTFCRIDTTATLPLNVWTKITATYDGVGSSGGVNVYFNDLLQAGTYGGSSTAVSNVLYETALFGAQNRGGSIAEFYSGNIDECSFWGKELTISEIQELTTSNAPTSVSFVGDLIEWFRFGDGDTFPTIVGKQQGYTMDMFNMTSANFVNDVP